MEIRALLRNFIMAKALHKVLEWKKEARTKRKAGCRKGVSYGSCAMGWAGSKAAVVARKEHVGGSDLCLLGTFNECAAAALLSYLQLHLFNSSKEAVEKSNGKRVEEVMMKAYDQLVRPFGEEQEEEEDLGGFVAAAVIGGERFVAADYGGYKAVLSNGGVATQVGGNPRKPDRARVLLRSLSGKLLRVTGGRHDEGSDEVKKGAAVVTGSVGSNTEFMVLASDGLWQVMGNQEVVDLVWHVEDPRQAAENLAREAVNRMSKSAVSCVVIRFA